MGVVIKQSFWGTFIAYLGVIVGYVNTLYLRAEYFDLAQIGVFTLVTANAMIVSPISSFGMGSSFIKYFPSFKEERRDEFFTFLFLITLVGNLLVLLVLFLFKDSITARYLETAPMYADYIAITGVIIVSNSFFELFFSYSRTILKVVFPSLLRDIYLRIGSLFVVLGYALSWWGFSTAVVGLGLVYLLAFIFLLLQLITTHNFRFKFNFEFIDREWKAKLFKFGTYSMMLAGSFALINNITYDQVTTILGSDMNGIYTTCFFIALIVEMPRRNMAKVISPIISTEFDRKNMTEVDKLYKRSSITMSVIGFLLFIGIVTNLQDLFNFIPKGSAFQAGFWVVVGVCFAKLILMASSFAGEIINYSHLYKYNLIFQVVAAVILVGLNYFMISSWGLNGAAISYVIAITIHVILKLSFVKHHFGIHPFDRSHLPLFIIGVAVTVGAYFFQPAFHPVINIAIRSILTVFVFIVLIYQFRISADINKIIHSTFERFLKINLPK
ncbi:MAG: polysaccharide biosynthesis C-terminal domain-containing protein [Ekhidna sp.]|uniref:lipopolysaccharide biosynthesis protein n=1 Tax=Ekhidna sp. TaxID=2608089 RepID=UPI0032ECAB65